jgi:hypothetical protein
MTFQSGSAASAGLETSAPRMSAVASKVLRVVLIAALLSIVV